mmetsp:Transcript_7364/g.12825  ORF Transcript_7364/g.12825 Transcript_7364/m.12825 type:complete len:355 (-) Transcript_7364:31-1095(-)
MTRKHKDGEEEDEQQRSSKEENEKEVSNKNDDQNDDDSSSSSSDEEDDDLVLEGVIVRNPDVSDSEDSSEEEEEKEEKEDIKPPARKRPSSGTDNDKKVPNGNKQKSKKQKRQTGPEIIPVEFAFCDVDEKYFHGLKTLLASSSPAYGANSSALADLMIQNISVGTVVSTEADQEEGTIYGFASVLNVTTYQEQECIQSLKKLCLSNCPSDRKAELETVLSGKTKRPAGFYLQSRMVNLPLEIVEVLHQQLVLDMEWAVKNADGGEEERKSLNFGAFVRLAPTYRSSGISYFKFFDDEIFAQHAEFTYEIALPKSYGMEEIPYCMVVVMTRTGHEEAMKSLKEMVNQSSIDSNL